MNHLFNRLQLQLWKISIWKLKHTPTHDDKHFEIPVVGFSADTISQIQAKFILNVVSKPGLIWAKQFLSDSQGKKAGEKS